MDMTEKPLPFNPPSPSSMQLDALSCRSIIRNMNLAQNRFFIATGFRCLVLIAIFAFSGPLFPASGQNAAPNQTPTPEQQAAKVNERLSLGKRQTRLAGAMSWEQGWRREHGQEGTGVGPPAQSNRMKPSTPLRC